MAGYFAGSVDYVDNINVIKILNYKTEFSASLRTAIAECANNSCSDVSLHSKKTSRTDRLHGQEKRVESGFAEVRNFRRHEVLVVRVI
jgi:hypothetical protein